MSKYRDPVVTRTSVYEFIIKFIEENGYPPTVREIADGMGVKSHSMVYGMMTMLHNLGLIHMEPKKPRAIKVIGYEFRKIKEE